jgi:N-acetylglucosaminyl-diphospho-decaprenol L-rhamnosyltransferase
VNVFIPTFNGSAMISDTLRTLAQQTARADVIVVDNGSRDDSVERVEREFPWVRILRLGSNFGFGPALNQAVRRYPADLLIFANNDVLYEPRFVEQLVDIADDRVAVAGVLCAQRDPTVIDSAGVIIDDTLLAFDYLHGRSVTELATAAAPLGPTGGAALVPLTAFNAVGGFDARIFAYLEDVDLALRLRATGVRCRLAPGARGIHRHSATLGSGSREKNRLMGWSRGYLLRRYGVMARPKQATRVLITEAFICVGQLAIDRTVTGISGRIRGWHAARGLDRRPLPAGATTPMSLSEALRRRAARRSVIKPFVSPGD